MDQATQVQIFQSTPDTITVNVRAGKWMDKAAAAGVDAIVFAPLLATAAFGAFKQQKLPQEIFSEIEDFIRSGGKSVTASMGASLAAKNKDTIICPNCHSENAKGTKFCPECGENLEKAKEKHCANCQTLISEDTKFCPECGTKVE